MVTLARWLDYVESQVGFILPTSQHSWLENAIKQTAGMHKIGVDELWKQVRKDSKTRQNLLDAVLILESRFFRHRPSIAFITKMAAQRQLEHDQSLFIKQTNKESKPSCSDEFRVWSVGCSEGQEVWTIAMSLTVAAIPNFHIVGSDFSTKALSSAKQAVYDSGSQWEIPLECQKFVKPLVLKKEQALKKKQMQASWEVDKALHKHVSFILSNAFLDTSDDIPTARLLTKQNVIICQNMLIYFRKFDQRDILARMVSRCAIGGHIILAPGEAVSWMHPQMQRVDNDQINAWKKIK